MPTAASAPRAIEGSVGSRIRVILGETGSEYLVLLNEDDGDREWQTTAWKGIPNALAKQINSCTSKGRYVKNVDFGTADSEWFVNGIKRDGSGDHSWWGGTLFSAEIKEKVGKDNVQVSFGSDWTGNETCVVIQGPNGYQTRNVDPDLSSRMKRINSRRKTIDFVRLFNNWGYFISDNEGSEWKGIGTECGKELKKSGTVNDVAVADDGSWVVIHPNSFVTSTGVDSELDGLLRGFFGRQRQRSAKRQREIASYHQEVARERSEREAREARERQEREQEAARQVREALEGAARAARETREREEREQAERERAEREAQEQRDRELAKKLAREEAARKADVSASLENAFEEHLKEDAKSIEELKELLRKRQRSFKASVEKLLPEKRACIMDEIAPVVLDASSGDRTYDCVVCHCAPAVRAVIPCGHQCLCDDCAVKLSNLGESGRLCPLCRTALQGTLKIYSTR